MNGVCLNTVSAIFPMTISSNNTIQSNLPKVSSFGLNSREEEVLPPMNVARRNFTSISFGTFIYVFGGTNDAGALNSCER